MTITPEFEPPRLERRLTLSVATITNVLTMVGAGPFITMPLLLGTMRGPLALLGWVIGGVVALCDGLIWAELGAAMPVSGGGYRYVLECYGAAGFGKLMSFLFLWQGIVVTPLLMASAAVGFAGYATYLAPKMTSAQSTLLAMGMCLLAMLLIYRRIDRIGRARVVLGIVTLLTGLWIVVEGVLHGRLDHVAVPAGAFQLSRGFWVGLGGATLYAMYDYAGYQTACNVGGEIQNPRVSIPASIMVAIMAVGIGYLAMNFSIISVIPWPEAVRSKFIVSDFIASLHDARAASLMTVLILLITFSGLFGGMLGASRVPYAAAAAGRFLSAFAQLHPVGRFPSFAVLYIGVASAFCCLFALDALIQAGTVITVFIQSLSVLGALVVLRARRRSTELPFRMWLYPGPVLVALVGWVYIILASGMANILVGVGVLIVGVVAYLWRALRMADWPFAVSVAPRQLSGRLPPRLRSPEGL